MNPNNEAVRVARNIEAVIEAIKVEGGRSQELIEARAKSVTDYDKAIATTIIRLKDGGTPTTIVEKIAKGECYEIRLTMEVADQTLKAHFARLDYLKSQLNGYQSINRHLDVT